MEAEIRALGERQTGIEMARIATRIANSMTRLESLFRIPLSMRARKMRGFTAAIPHRG